MDAVLDSEWSRSRDGYITVDGVVIVEGVEAVLGVNLKRPIVTNGDFATRLFPDYFGQFLLSYISTSAFCFAVWMAYFTARLSHCATVLFSTCSMHARVLYVLLALISFFLLYLYLPLYTEYGWDTKFTVCFFFSHSFLRHDFTTKRRQWLDDEMYGLWSGGFGPRGGGTKEDLERCSAKTVLST